MVEIDYVNYVREQQAIRFNYLEERKALVNIPFRTGLLRGSARLSYRQNVYDLLTYNTTDLTLSTHLGPVSANFSGFASWVSQGTPYIYSNLTLGFRLRQGWNFRPQMQYDFTNSEIVSYKFDLEKRIRRSGYLAMGYQENVLADYRSLELTVRWDLPFAQVNTSTRLSRYDLTTTQGARGGISMGSGNGYVHIDSRSSIGRGGITIIPFVDINHNGIRDEGEPLASGLAVRLNGGRTLRGKNDSLIRMAELEPYVSYIIELDDANLDNIAWQLPFKVIRVKTDPNQFKKLYIPVRPGGEINGMITLRDENRIRGIGRVILNIYNTNDELVRQVMSESDGYMTYLGLAPGEYFARIDSVQLERIGMDAIPQRIDFQILPMVSGDIVDGLDFELQRILKTEEQTGELNHIEQPEKQAGEGSLIIQQEVSEQTGEPVTPPQHIAPSTKLDEIGRTDQTNGQQDVISDPHSGKTAVDSIRYHTSDTTILFSPSRGIWFVQSGAFSSMSNTLRHYSALQQQIDGYPMGIVLQDGAYRIRFGHFYTYAEAEGCKTAIIRQGSKAFTGRSENGRYYLEPMSFPELSEALSNAQKLAEILSVPIFIQKRNGTYHLQTGFFVSSEQAEAISIILKNNGFSKESLVIWMY
jgi:hypothetical protein